MGKEVRPLRLGSTPWLAHRSGSWPCAALAQSAEHPPCKRTVVGSIPTRGSKNQATRASEFRPSAVNVHPAQADLRPFTCTHRRARRDEESTLQQQNSDNRDYPRTVTATHASRGFSEVLDRVEQGETIRITRDGHLVAELRPITPATGRALRAALA